MSQSWLSNSRRDTHNTDTTYSKRKHFYSQFSTEAPRSMLCAAESHWRITKPGLPVVCCLLNVKCYDLACWAIKRGISLECCHVVENSSHCHLLLTTTQFNNQLVSFCLFGGITHHRQTAREQVCVSVCVNTCVLRCVCVPVCNMLLGFVFSLSWNYCEKISKWLKALVTFFHTTFLILNRK